MLKSQVQLLVSLQGKIQSWPDPRVDLQLQARPSSDRNTSCLLWCGRYRRRNLQRETYTIIKPHAASHSTSPSFAKQIPVAHISMRQTKAHLSFGATFWELDLAALRLWCNRCLVTFSDQTNKQTNLDPGWRAEPSSWRRSKRTPGTAPGCTWTGSLSLAQDRLRTKKNDYNFW